MVLDFKYSDEDEMSWESQAAMPVAEANRPGWRQAVDLRQVSEVALAVAVGALPLSDLRRLLETFARGGEIDKAEPVDVCGGEDSGCTSFLDRYLGGGADPDFLDEAELFKVA